MRRMRRSVVSSSFLGGIWEALHWFVRLSVAEMICRGTHHKTNRFRPDVISGLAAQIVLGLGQWLGYYWGHGVAPRPRSQFPRGSPWLFGWRRFGALGCRVAPGAGKEPHARGDRSQRVLLRAPMADRR